jgi:hypothetical protein
MRVLAVIDDPKVIEKILRHLGAWHDPPASSLQALRAPTPTSLGMTWTECLITKMS